MTDELFDLPPVMESSVEPAVSVATLTPLAQQYLDQTRPWVRFLSVVAFVMAGFMLVVGGAMFAVGIFGSMAARSQGDIGPLGSAIGMSLVSLLYMASAALYIAPGVFLHRYASAIRDLKATSNGAALEGALKHQKSFWRYVGILTVIGLIITVVIIVLAVVVGAFAAMMAARSSGLRT